MLITSQQCLDKENKHICTSDTNTLKLKLCLKTKQSNLKPAALKSFEFEYVYF